MYQGKGKRDRNAMLSPGLLEILRAWWRDGQAQHKLLPGGWLFPGQNPVDPLSTRQLNRAFHFACKAAGIDKRVSLHSFGNCSCIALGSGILLRPISPIHGVVPPAYMDPLRFARHSIIDVRKNHCSHISGLSMEVF